MTTHTPLRCANSVMTQRGSSEVVLFNTGNYPVVSNFLNQTWTWNGTDWTNTGTGSVIDPNGPPGRTATIMSYDGTNVMLFGGQGNPSVGMLNDTWTWNGTVWTKKTPATSPFARYQASSDYLSGTGTVMFGGFGGTGGVLTETWVWNGTNWTLQNPTTVPPGRVNHVMASGPSYVLMFGGAGTNSYFNDTWKYDGSNWTKLTPAISPSVRTDACMAYDTAHSRWVLFGGSNGSNYLNETWTFDGTTWTQVFPTSSPAGRIGSQMCYDSQSSSVLLFGGISAAIGDASDHTWKWNGTNWSQQ